MDFADDADGLAGDENAAGTAFQGCRTSIAGDLFIVGVVACCGEE
jgi:hypothetical protein